MTSPRGRYILACRHIHAGCRIVANAASVSRLIEALDAHAEATHGAPPPLKGAHDRIVFRLNPNPG
jgi:predicted small metal-binding protein